MIAKHISMKSAGKSDFFRLVNYITNPQQKSERVGQVSVTNCHNDQPDVAALEVLNTQLQNRRVVSDKSYHLIVSFRAGEQPPPETLKAIEARISEGLGYAEHQRISAVHHDSDNVHLHIAINKIHPTRYTIHDPYRDYWTLAKLCEKLEHEYGLEPDNHQARKSLSENRAQDMERHSGMESLLSWVKRECLGPMQQAQSWPELHQVLHNKGLEIRERANGLVITNGQTMVKASTVSRELSKAKLEARLGPFQPGLTPNIKPSRQYQPRPVRTRVDTSELYAKYRTEQDHCRREGQAQLLAARKRRTNAIEVAKRTGQLERAAIKFMPVGPLGKRALYSLAATSLRKEINKVVKQHQAERRAIQQKYRRDGWVDWLRKKATEGNTAALAALRAREGAQKLKGNTLTGQARQMNGAMDPTIDGITKKGTIVYRVGTGTIRDDGIQLAVSKRATEETVEAALRMALKRYGYRLTVTGSDEFKERAAFVAAKTRLSIMFADGTLENRRRTLAAQLRGLGLRGTRPVDEANPAVVQRFGIMNRLIKQSRSRGRSR